MFEDYKKCLFCNKAGVPLFKVYEWNKPDSYSWYCQEHYKQVQAFNAQQKRDFVNEFQSEMSRAYLSPKQLELWERCRKEIG